MFLSPVSGLYAALLENQRSHCSLGLSFFLLLETGYVGLDLKHVIKLKQKWPEISGRSTSPIFSHLLKG